MARETREEKIKRARQILAKLKKVYPDAKCSLDYRNSLQLIVATILSAQCTDARVNKTTPALFARYRSAQDFADADIGELQEIIRSTGFYKNKAKNIKAMAQALVQKHRGRVPQTMEELSSLPGVGRKTANVVLGVAFGVPALVVDTHVTRLSNRMGLVRGKDAVKLEFELMKIIDQKDWTHFAHLFIQHGRGICMARNPQCDVCPVAKLCPKLI